MLSSIRMFSHTLSITYNLLYVMFLHGLNIYSSRRFPIVRENATAGDTLPEQDRKAHPEY